MTTQFLMPERRLSLNMPTGRGLHRVVEVSSKHIHPTLVFAGAEPLPASAQYQEVADNLLHGDWWTPRQIFVTSPSTGDGKTCTSFNLAWAMSSRDRSVLLVELNFARPQFRTVLGDLRIWHGIDGVLRGSAKPADSVFSIAANGLDVCAVRDATPFAQLKQYLPRLKDFFAWASENYDWLILDCPPVLSLPWRQWFSEYAGPTLLVVREQQTPMVETRKAAKLLGANLKGVLLNDSVVARQNSIRTQKGADF
jgi:Mrp family chromosome partitioning ATPase